MKTVAFTIPPGAGAANGTHSHQQAHPDRGAFSFAYKRRANPDSAD